MITKHIDFGITRIVVHADARDTDSFHLHQSAKLVCCYDNICFPFRACSVHSSPSVLCDTVTVAMMLILHVCVK